MVSETNDFTDTLPVQSVTQEEYEGIVRLCDEYWNPTSDQLAKICEEHLYETAPNPHQVNDESMDTKQKKKVYPVHIAMSPLEKCIN